MAKQKLTIKVNGKTYTKTTDSKGQASVSVSFANENTYVVNVNYKGNKVYKASGANGKINVAKFAANIDSYDKSYSKDSAPKYEISLKDSSGNALSNKNVIFTFNGNSYEKTTDANGKASLDLVNPGVGSFDIKATFSGSDKYKSVSKTNRITILNKTETTFIDSGLPNAEIQNILDACSAGENIEFLGSSYHDVNLNIRKAANIYSLNKTTLYGKSDNPVFNVEANNVSLSGFSIMAKSNSAIAVNYVEKATVSNNSISNVLDNDKLSAYADATLNMPGYGIAISNSGEVRLSGNDISLFESGIFVQNSSDLSIDANRITQNNYGIKYGYGVANTQIVNNEISRQTGLYIMTVPEGPSGYGIFLNSSAVNVTINQNHIFENHLGISIDANYSTGIVITQNTITDNVLEGIRFNAGYDLAENAVEPHVTDNAIYRNARGPSMMILGELSANPFGIYGNGLYNPSDKLKLEPNWYGTNNLETWDNDTGVVGYGTMCPRINTTNIQFNMTRNSPGNYSIKFYKNGVLASNLPLFDMFATLNRGTDNEVEVAFDVIDGVGTFTFDSLSYNDVKNVIEISIGSLLNSTSRVFKVAYLYEES